ncbi:MAG TPA: glycosyltransferase family 9 protein [Bacteroidota bacterium]|jgi:lipopolysaccharide heptosyltransferase II|nr:glycosyltransferase family 9 protein [Bacteroidota bacterium]
MELAFEIPLRRLCRMKIERAQVRKILVIKLRAIGDVLLSTIVLDNLRAAFPHARIHFLTERPSREVIEGNPNLDGVLIFDGKYEHGLGLIVKVRRKQFDLVIDLFGNPRSALVTLFSGARYRVGYRFKWRKYCYNIVVEPRGGEVHNAEFNLDALRKMEVSIIARDISFPLDAAAEQFAESFAAEAGLSGKRVIALNPGGGWYTKRWRIQHFARLGDLIAEEFDASILLIWGPGEEEDASVIQSIMRSKSVVIPRTNLKQLAALLKRCSVLVTNDSGPMHIAAAMKTSVVAIFGPTNPDLQGPFGVKHEIVQNQQLLCLGCNYTKCPIGNPCMEDLSVDDVFRSFKMLMGSPNLVSERSR